jgi:hypothetical protein
MATVSIIQSDQLLGDGRNIEAAALIDKAEVMSSPVSADASAQPNGQPSNGEGAIAKPVQPFAARLVADISSRLTKVLVGAFQDLELHLTDESRRLTSALSDRLERIQAAVESHEIICLTPETIDKPWLYFEAGALMRELGGNKNLIVPYLYDCEEETLNGPFAQFQTVLADKAGTFKLIIDASRKDRQPREDRKSLTDVSRAPKC